MRPQSATWLKTTFCPKRQLDYLLIFDWSFRLQWRLFPQFRNLRTGDWCSKASYCDASSTVTPWSPLPRDKHTGKGLTVQERLQPTSFKYRLLDHNVTLYFAVHHFDASVRSQVIKWQHFLGTLTTLPLLMLCNRICVLSSVCNLRSFGNDLLLPHWSK